MKKCFLERGYSVQCIDEAFQVASSKTRYDLLQKSVKKDKSYSVSFISTYTPQAYIAKNTILKYWPILTSDPTVAQHFKDPPSSFIEEVQICVIK